MVFMVNRVNKTPAYHNILIYFSWCTVPDYHNINLAFSSHKHETFWFRSYILADYQHPTWRTPWYRQSQKSSSVPRNVAWKRASNIPGTQLLTRNVRGNSGSERGITSYFKQRLKMIYKINMRLWLSDFTLRWALAIVYCQFVSNKASLGYYENLLNHAGCNNMNITLQINFFICHTINWNVLW